LDATQKMSINVVFLLLMLSSVIAALPLEGSIVINNVIVGANNAL